jgi:hypothetical protein
MSSKITHLKSHNDGWWLNKAVDVDSKPRELGLGLVTLAAGGVRFVDAKTTARSGGAFANALAQGLISGPFASQAEALGVKPEPVKAPVEAKIEEPVKAQETVDPESVEDLEKTEKKPAVAKKAKP